MATKEKLFRRGVGFTFTPSRIPDVSDVDFIDELNILYINSNLSQNKFLETMLKDAIEYAKLRNAGLLPTVNKPINPLVNHAVIANNLKESENLNTASNQVELAFSHSRVTQDETKAEDVPGSKTNSETIPVELDAVTRRAMERAQRAKLKQ